MSRQQHPLSQAKHQQRPVDLEEGGTESEDGAPPEEKATNAGGGAGGAGVAEWLPRPRSVVDAPAGRAQPSPESAARTPLRHPNPCSWAGSCSCQASCLFSWLSLKQCPPPAA